MCFQYGFDEKNLTVLADNQDGTILSVEKAGGFVGTIIGMFAARKNQKAEKDFYADFDWFKYDADTSVWIDK